MWFFDDNKCRAAAGGLLYTQTGQQQQHRLSQPVCTIAADYFRLLKDDCRCRGLCRMMAFHPIPTSIQGRLEWLSRCFMILYWSLNNFRGGRKNYAQCASCVCATYMNIISALVCRSSINPSSARADIKEAKVARKTRIISRARVAWLYNLQPILTRCPDRTVNCPCLYGGIFMCTDSRHTGIPAQSKGNFASDSYRRLLWIASVWLCVGFNDRTRSAAGRVRRVGANIFYRPTHHNKLFFVF